MAVYFNVIVVTDRNGGFDYSAYASEVVRICTEIIPEHGVIITDTQTHNLISQLPNTGIITDNLVEGLKQTQCNHNYVIGGYDLTIEAIQSVWCQQIYQVRLVQLYWCDTSFTIDLSMVPAYHHQTTITTYTLTIYTRIVTSGEHDYIKLLRRALDTHIYAECIKFDLNDGFPLLTTADISFSQVVEDASKCLKSTHDHGFHLTRYRYCQFTALIIAVLMGVYTISVDLYGVCGVIVAVFILKLCQHSPTLDQVKAMLTEVQTNPLSHQLIVTLWNPAHRSTPTSLLYQLSVSPDKRVHMVVCQRSGDLVFEIPSVIPTYGLILHQFAHVLKLRPGVLTVMIHNPYICKRHLDIAVARTKLVPRPLPQLEITGEYTLDTLNTFTQSSFKLHDYTSSL